MGGMTLEPKTKVYGVWCSSCGDANTYTVGPKGGMELQVPIMTNFIDCFLEDFDKGFIWSFSLTITLWVVWGGEVMLDGELPT